MILFIDRLPIEGLFAFLPMTAVDPGKKVPRPRTHRQWKVDTGCGPEAYAWRSHLLEAGLDPAAHRGGTGEIRPAAGPAVERHRRKAHLLLFSNIPALEHHPFRLELSNGITLAEDADSDPADRQPMVGMKALRAAGVQILFNLSGKTTKRNDVSVWIPRAAIPQAPSRVFLFARRVMSGFATLPIQWDD
jgi:hypothetical protein